MPSVVKARKFLKGNIYNIKIDSETETRQCIYHRTYKNERVLTVIAPGTASTTFPGSTYTTKYKDAEGKNIR